MNTCPYLLIPALGSYLGACTEKFIAAKKDAIEAFLNHFREIKRGETSFVPLGVMALFPIVLSAVEGYALKLSQKQMSRDESETDLNSAEQGLQQATHYEASELLTGSSCKHSQITRSQLRQSIPNQRSFSLSAAKPTSITFITAASNS